MVDLLSHVIDVSLLPFPIVFGVEFGAFAGAVVVAWRLGEGVMFGVIL